MVKNLLIIGLIRVSLVACTSAEKSTPKAEKTEVKDDVAQIDEVELVVVEPNRLLTMELEGMVCSMGCGGSIRKELKATGAVAQCDFDFEDERPLDIATIEFDKDKITVDEIIAIVSKINDGQFIVGKRSSEVFQNTEIKETKKSSRKTSVAKVEASTFTFQFPNIFGLFF